MYTEEEVIDWAKSENLSESEFMGLLKELEDEIEWSDAVAVPKKPSYLDRTLREIESLLGLSSKGEAPQLDEPPIGAVTQPPQGIPDLDQQKLQKEERQYYEDHPNLVLTPTGEKTEFGMPIYLDQYKNHHSESSETFQLDNEKWVTAPMIWEGRYFTQKETKALIQSTGLKNPTTGEDIPVFGTKNEALQYAIDRDRTLRDKKHPWNQIPPHNTRT